ncbi:MAG TPA: UDP-3-O-(3-hydroxymyristoyl)glucosamine N-acyltransferase [Gammaproteobacteria bacterium]|nr:UDP-3-O-(3-hydroxymyristoyl)glucosamine N-acyltransferase [Gammaproteobacteria bacterium]
MGVAYTLKELADRCGGDVRGDGSTRVQAVATLQNATPGSIAFLANPHYRRFLPATRASAVILNAADADACPVPALVSANPYLLYAHIAALLAPQAPARHGVDPAAHVSRDARVDAAAWVGPGAVVETGAMIAGHASVGPNCVIMEGAKLGEGSRLVANATLCPRVEVGRRALIHPGAVIGADGFGIARDGAAWVKVPQLGSVRIGDDVEIGANTTIDRGALEDTVIEDGVKLDNQIQVGHNVRIGAHTAVAGCAAIAGSAVIGKRCMIAGGAGVAGHIEICDDVTITAMTLVSHTITRAGVYSGSLPMDDAGEWRKNSARFRQLDKLARRVADLEKKTKG